MMPTPATIQEFDRQLAQTLIGFYDDPLAFVMWAFPWGVERGPLANESKPDTWQIQFLEQLGEAIQARAFDGNLPVEPIRMARASGHGIGKSTLLAMVFWFVMSTRVNAKGRVTANTFTQLESTTWAEIRKWWEMLPCKHWFTVTGSRACRIGAEEQWFAIPLTCAEENSEAFAGQHNKNSTSFFLFDEASLIPDKIWEVAEAGMTDGEPMMFVCGNPTRNTGAFHDVCFTPKSIRWNVCSIDSRTCKFPNHALHDEWIRDHGIDSDFVRVRVLGQPPRTAETQLIGSDLVLDAQRRAVFALIGDPLMCGVDVPDGGSAWFVIRFRRGLDSRPGTLIPAPVRIAGSQINREQMIHHCARVLMETSPDKKVAMMFVDSAFGAAIVERLHVLGFDNVQEITFGDRSPDPHFGNMRAYMWAKEMKDWLGRGAIDPEDKNLAKQLVQPGFKFRVGGDGALLVESKEEMRKRIPNWESVDDADALALTFARPVAPVETGLRSSGGYRDPRGWMG